MIPRRLNVESTKRNVPQDGQVECHVGGDRSLQHVEGLVLTATTLAPFRHSRRHSFHSRRSGLGLSFFWPFGIFLPPFFSEYFLLFLGDCHRIIRNLRGYKRKSLLPPFDLEKGERYQARFKGKRSQRSQRRKKVQSINHNKKKCLTLWLSKCNQRTVRLPLPPPPLPPPPLPPPPTWPSCAWSGTT